MTPSDDCPTTELQTLHALPGSPTLLNQGIYRKFTDTDVDVDVDVDI